MTEMLEGYSIKETLGRLEGKLDGLTTQISGLQLTVAALEPRIVALEKAGERRWQLVPTWIASGVALVLAMLPYLH